MKQFWYKFKNAMSSFSYGRYGVDELSRALYVAGFILFILSMFKVLYFLYPLGLILLIWSMFRCLSKNRYKRERERNIYLRATGRVRSFFSIQLRRFKERKDYKYYRCPQCRTYNRIPKGHGKIIITCPKCRNQFQRKS